MNTKNAKCVVDSLDKRLLIVKQINLSLRYFDKFKFNFISVLTLQQQKRENLELSRLNSK